MQGAIEADKKQDYDEAYKLYSNALDYFMLALKCLHSSSQRCMRLTHMQTRRTRSQSS